MDSSDFMFEEDDSDIIDEETLDSVVQHMVASQFSHEKIRRDLGVSEEFIIKAITPRG